MPGTDHPPAPTHLVRGVRMGGLGGSAPEPAVPPLRADTGVRAMRGMYDRLRRQRKKPSPDRSQQCVAIWRRKVGSARTEQSQGLAGEHRGQGRYVPDQATRGDPGRVDRLQPDTADIEHQAGWDRVVGSTFWLDLSPDDEIVGVEVRHGACVVRQRHGDVDGFRPDVRPENRPETS